MFILETSACTSVSVLAAILFIKKLTKVLSIIVPAILILMLSIDFAEAVIASNDDQMKKAQSIAVKRIIYAALIFFVPIIVDAMFVLIDGNISVKSQCYSNAESGVIEALSTAENEKQIKEDRDRIAIIEATKKGIAKKKTTTKKSSSSSSSLSARGTELSEKIAKTAESIAWPKGTSVSKYDHLHSNGKAYGDFEIVRKKYGYGGGKSYDCGVFVRTVLRASTGNKKIPYVMATKSRASLEKQISKYGFEVLNWDGKLSSVRRGDVMTYKNSGSGQHVMVYLGDGYVAEASYVPHKTEKYGRIQKISKKKKSLSGKKRYLIVRAK